MTTAAPLPATPPPAAPGAPARPPRRSIVALWREHPFVVVLGVALALRVVAAFLSRGFAFHDDHFEVVEVAQRWLDGQRDWLGQGDAFRSLVYPGLHWAVFAALRAMGIEDPQAKMLVVRVLHAAWSLLTVAYGWRIAERVAGKEKARLAGLLLAAFWLAPFAAVHDLVEVACQPPLVIATWLLVRREDGPGARDALLAGAWLGVAFTIRFQTLVVPGALGLTLLLQRRLRAAILLGVGTALSATVLQGGSDWLGYGRPFSSFLAYLAYNSNPANLTGYPHGPWYQYLLTLAGVLVPPTSLLLLAGAVRSGRKLPLLLWPVVLFVAVHSAYPGKQERFLFPVLPLLLVLGGIGAQALAEEWAPLRRHSRTVRALWIWFWIANCLLLALYTANYSKRTRVEPLTWLDRTADLRGVVLETSEPRSPFIPRFYLTRQVPVYTLAAGDEVAPLAAEIARATAPPPNYVVMTGVKGLEARVARLAPFCPAPVEVETFRPGAVDWLLHRMNPRHNVNLTATIYRCRP